jgi:hypothetical protein
MIKIQLAELPAVRTDGGMEMSTETFMRLNTTWQHANVALAIQIWGFLLWQASSGRTGPFSVADLQREMLPPATAKRRRGDPKPFTTSEVEQCMAHLVEFGLMKFSSSEPDSIP